MPRVVSFLTIAIANCLLTFYANHHEYLYIGNNLLAEDIAPRRLTTHTLRWGEVELWSQHPHLYIGQGSQVSKRMEPLGRGELSWASTLNGSLYPSVMSLYLPHPLGSAVTVSSPPRNRFGASRSYRVCIVALVHVHHHSSSHCPKNCHPWPPAAVSIWSQPLTPPHPPPSACVRAALALTHTVVPHSTLRRLQSSLRNQSNFWKLPFC